MARGQFCVNMIRWSKMPTTKYYVKALVCLAHDRNHVLHALCSNSWNETFNEAFNFWRRIYGILYLFFYIIFIYQVLCTLIYRRPSIYSYLKDRLMESVMPLGIPRLSMLMGKLHPWITFNSMFIEQNISCRASCFSYRYPIHIPSVDYILELWVPRYLLGNGNVMFSSCCDFVYIVWIICN